MSKDKSARVLISLHPTLLDMVDEKAKLTCKSRSEFIRDSVRFFIQHGDHFDVPAKETQDNAEPEQLDETATDVDATGNEVDVVDLA